MKSVRLLTLKILPPNRRHVFRDAPCARQTFADWWYTRPPGACRFTLKVPPPNRRHAFRDAPCARQTFMGRWNACPPGACRFTLELRRLLQSPLTWLTIFLTLLSPLAGLYIYQPASASTMHTMYLANPALAGGAAGGILFALLTVYELDRAGRSRMDVLVDAAVSPLTMALVRLLALAGAAILTLGAVMALWLPITAKLIGSVFHMEDYLLAYVIFMGLALPLSILAAASAFQFTRRADLSLAIFAAFAGLSLTVWSDRWQLCWLNPCVWALSDDFSNLRIFRSAAWMRMTWLGALTGIWILSWLSIRQYGKGLLGSLSQSLARNARLLYRPAAAFLLLVCSGTAFAAQPFVDQSNPDQTVMTFLEIPFLEGVSFLHRSVFVCPDTAAGTVAGKAIFQLQNHSGQTQTLAFGINPGYKISSVQANGRDASFSVSDDQEYNESLLQVTIPPAEDIELSIEYGGFPQEDSSMSAMQGRLEISDEYLCLENSVLSPRLMNVPPVNVPLKNVSAKDVPEAEYVPYPTTIEITLPAHMTVIPFSPSQPEKLAENTDGTITWRYEDSGTGGILYAGDYLRQDIEAGGLTIQLYYGRRHQAVMEAAGAAQAVKAVVDYCTEHYGPLSFGADGTLKLIQSRVSGGGYARNGASLLDEVDFTAANLDDAGKGTVPGEVMIHELVHQWWGLANMFDPASANDAWSAEGLTVYTTYRIVKELYGEDSSSSYARENYVKKWLQAVDDYQKNFYVRNPRYLAALPQKEQLNISNSLSYVRRYNEMPLKILKAEQLVGGEEAMDAILCDLFNRELDYTYPYLTYSDFLDACGLTEEELNLKKN